MLSSVRFQQLLNWIEFDCVTILFTNKKCSTHFDFETPGNSDIFFLFLISKQITHFWVG